MSIDLIIMPLLTMLSGTISLYIDPKNPKIKWVKPLMLSIVILSGILTIVSSYNNNKSAKTEKLELQNRINELKEQNKQLMEKIIKIPDETAARISKLQEFGFSYERAREATPQEIIQSKNANQELMSSQVNNQDIERRKTITIEYFPKDVDKNILISALKALGFQFKLGTPKNSDPTNAIWFGSNASLEDVKLVAYTLIRAGVQIRTIKPFRQPSEEPWASKIQVGSDPDYKNTPPLTVEKIRNVTSFSRQ